MSVTRVLLSSLQKEEYHFPLPLHSPLPYPPPPSPNTHTPLLLPWHARPHLSHQPSVGDARLNTICRGESHVARDQLRVDAIFYLGDERITSLRVCVVAGERKGPRARTKSIAGQQRHRTWAFSWPNGVWCRNRRGRSTHIILSLTLKLILGMFVYIYSKEKY